MLAHLIATLTLLAAQTGGGSFHDDFETGVLDPAHWVRGGRDLAGTGVTDVQPRGGSLAGHVYHRSFTETNLAAPTYFPVIPSSRLDLDMEVRAADPGSPGGAYYAMAGMFVYVFDGATHGVVEFIFSTSTYRSTLYANDPLHKVVTIPQNTWQHHSYTVADLCAMLPGLNAAKAQSLNTVFNSYCSWWNGSADGDVWFDNFTVDGIPATLAANPAQPVAGSYASITAAGMETGRSAYLAYSIAGLGTTSVPQLGLALDIAAARAAAPPAVVSVAGEAAWTLLVPLQASGLTVWLQAAHFGRSTRVLELLIL